MAERATIARPYAKAAFAHASENQVVPGWSRWLEKAAGVVGSEEYARLALSPGITDEQLTGLDGAGIGGHTQVGPVCAPQFAAAGVREFRQRAVHAASPPARRRNAARATS